MTFDDALVDFPAGKCTVLEDDFAKLGTIWSIHDSLSGQ